MQTKYRVDKLTHYSKANIKNHVSNMTARNDVNPTTATKNATARFSAHVFYVSHFQLRKTDATISHSLESAIHCQRTRLSALHWLLATYDTDLYWLTTDLSFPPRGTLAEMLTLCSEAPRVCLTTRFHSYLSRW